VSPVRPAWQGPLLRRTDLLWTITSEAIETFESTYETQPAGVA